ncbi:MAG: hypothetical protein Q8J71_06150 [Brevundimonas sp.]|nr:hypothetical protein [Brevundimonas sp.]
MQFKQPGPWLFAAGMIALGVVYLVLASSLGWPVGPLCLIIAGSCLLFQRTGRVAAGVLALYWLVPLVGIHAYYVFVIPMGVVAWVDGATALIFLTVAAAFAHSRLWPAARITLGLTLVLFGGVHILQPTASGGLLPGWFAAPAVWPYIAGAIQIAAGVTILAGFRAPLAAFVVGLMWLSWIPLVHLPRLIDTPASGTGAPVSGAEWIFMATALALAGAAWSVGERSAAQPGEDLQRSAR